MEPKSCTILLVEDDPDHADLIRLGFEEHWIETEIQHVTDGEDALDYLFRRGDYAEPLKSPRPDIILLDLRLPKMDGLDILKEIKDSKELRHIPVIVLTTSQAKKDTLKAYDYHVNSYLVKPLDFFQFREMINELGFYWLGKNISNSDLREL